MSLHDLQTRVHVAKDKRNDFGGYNYRTAEGILAAIKAALPEGAYIIVSDEVQEVGGQIFVTATALIDQAACRSAAISSRIATTFVATSPLSQRRFTQPFRRSIS